MRTLLSLALVASLVLLSSGCMLSQRSVNFDRVAKDHNMINITTGDGEFNSYTAVGHYSSVEIGLGLGIPMIKVLELFPRKSNEAQVAALAKLAAADGANAMIRVEVPKSTFYGFIFGLYLDQTDATGIKTK